MQSTRECNVEKCATAGARRGLCYKHYKQWRAGEPHPAVATPTAAERLWARVDKTAQCWNWTGSTDSGGYGQIRVSGRLVKVHRLSWEITQGKLPPSIQLDHQCRNKVCVNPDHLLPTGQMMNNENRGLPKNNRSGFRGVSWYAPMKLWVAKVGHAGKQYHVGYFETALDAHLAATARRNELHTNNLSDRGE